MGAAAYAFSYEEPDDKYREMTEYLSTEGGYWLKEDKWAVNSDAFKKAGLDVEECKVSILADFSTYTKERMKTEMKYYLLYSMKNGWLSPFHISNVLTTTIWMIGEVLGQKKPYESFGEMEQEIIAGKERTETPVILKKYRTLVNQVIVYFICYSRRDNLLSD